jgi:hypothetical protein
MVTTLVLRPLQAAVSGRMKTLQDDGITRLELLINRRIHYASMGPSVFGTVDIRNIRISGSGDEPALAISRLRVSYSLWDLLRGNGTAAVHSILIDKPVIALDAERDGDLQRLFVSWRDQLFAEPLDQIFLSENLVIRIRGGACTLRDGENRLIADDAALQITKEKGWIKFQGRWDTDVFYDGLFNRSLGADFSGKITGEVSEDLQRGYATLSVPSLRTDLFSLRPLTVNCILAEGKIELRKIDDYIPLDLRVGYEPGSGKLSGEFQSEDFLLGELFSFAGPWAKYNTWLALRTTGSASFELDREGNIQYDLDLAGAVPAGMSWDRGDAFFNITGRGDERVITIDQAAVRAGPGSLGFSGEVGLEPFALNGTISVAGVNLSGDGEVNGNFNINTNGREFNVFGENLSLGSVALSALDADIQWEDEGISFFVSAQRSRNIESDEDVRLSSLSLNGSYNFNPREFQVNFMPNAFSLLDLIDMARPFGQIPAIPDLAADVVDNISVTAEIFVTTDFEHILYNAPRVVAAYGGEPEVFSVFSLSGTDRYMELEEGRIVWADGVTLVSGSTDFSNIQDISFSLRLAYEETAYYFEGILLDQRSLSIQGAYGLSLYVNRTDFGGYSGYIETSAFPIRINEQFALVTLLASMRYESETQWSFDLSRLEVQNLSIPASPVTAINIRGVGDQYGAVFPALLFDDGRGLLSGRALVAWDEDFSTISGTITMANPEDAEEFTMTGGLSGGSLNLHLEVSRLQLSRIIRNSNNIVVTGLTDITWNSWESFHAEVTVSSLAAMMGETPVHVSAVGSLDADEFFVENLQVAYGGLNAEFPYLRMNRTTPVVETEARIYGAALGRDMDVSLAAKVSFNPLDSWFNIGQVLRSFDGALLIHHIRLNTIESQAPFDFIFSRTESFISFSGGPEEMIRMQITDNGIFYADFSDPSPIRGSISGTITDGAINAHSSDLNIDLGVLHPFISDQKVEFTEGIITASLDIQGPLADPEFFGTAQGRDVRIRIPQFLTEDIGPSSLTLMLDGTDMTFGPLDVKVGSGQGRVSGWFRFDRWIPNTFSIDIQAVYERAIPFGLDLGGLKAQGLTSGVLNVSMENNILSVTGDLTGYDTEITLDTQEFTGETSENIFSTSPVPVVLNINIRTGNKVEFFWPNADFPIIRAQADRGASLTVQSDSQTQRYAVVGDVNLRSGEIYYFQRSFYLREGTLYFNENEIQFEPRISARAEIREYSNDGPVTISLIVDQSPLESFIPRFESSPPLSQIDIISILGQNLTGTSMAEGSDVLANVLAVSSDLLAQFRVVRRLERYVRDFTRLDMFSFRSQVLQNAVLDVTRLQAPVDRTSWVSNYFDNTAVFLGKYIGSDMFFQSMFSLRYDENKKTMGGYTFEPDFGIELRSPLFDIRWDFIPRHPENMFVNDHSITLTRRWTF